MGQAHDWWGETPSSLPWPVPCYARQSMTWNKRTTDCFENFGNHTLPPHPRSAPYGTCIPVNDDDTSRLGLRSPTIDASLVRDLLFGPKVLAELAILRRLASV